jgi:broad specificity phosphatase PhoE
LREGLDFIHEGYGSDILQQRFPLAVLPPEIELDGWQYGGDTQETMFDRCNLILHRVHKRFAPDDTIVIIAHGGILTYLLHVILHISPQTPAWFELDFGSISRISFVPEEQRQAYLPLYPEMEVMIMSINEKTHLINLSL